MLFIYSAERNVPGAKFTSLNNSNFVDGCVNRGQSVGKRHIPLMPICSCNFESNRGRHSDYGLVKGGAGNIVLRPVFNFAGGSY